jgi:hypothetical protein
VTTRSAKGGIFSRRMLIALAAMGIIALALGYFVHPVYAGGVAKLQESQQNTDSSDASDECKDEDAVPAGKVLWHFILNGLEPGITSAVPGHFEFDGAGTLDVSSSKWNPDGKTHHFYVFTTGDDILLDATADIGDSAYNNLVLSHICHGDETEQSIPASAEQSVAASVSASVPASVAASVPAASVRASAEQSVKAGTGTPAASTSNTALFGDGSNPLPTIAFSLILLASLGTLAYANIRSVRS